MQDDHLQISQSDRSNSDPVRMQLLTNLMVTQPNSTKGNAQYDPITRKEDTLNTLALWMTVAPITVGINAEGTQPHYEYRADWIPAHHTSSARSANNQWTVTYIENFIRVPVGAAVLGDVVSWPSKRGDVSITSTVFQSKLDSKKPKLLAVPPAIILICAWVLIVCNLRLATLSEV
ncbi:hypothetical protein PSPO01_09685 [Paraphaeosphaeria sporulosa]